MIWSDSVRLGMVANVTLEKGKKIKYNTIPIYIGDDYIPLWIMIKIIRGLQERIIFIKE